MNKIINFIWKIITLPLKGLDIDFGKDQIEDSEERKDNIEVGRNENENVSSQSAEANRVEVKKDVFDLDSFDGKYKYAKRLLERRYRNYALAKTFVSLIDTCDTHDEKCELVILFIENFYLDPDKLHDQVQEETTKTTFRMERLAMSHLAFIKSLVHWIMLNNGDSVQEFADDFTRVVFASPSVFRSKIERAYALFRGTWLWYNTYVI